MVRALLRCAMLRCAVLRCAGTLDERVPGLEEPGLEATRFAPHARQPYVCSSRGRPAPWPTALVDDYLKKTVLLI